MTKENIFCLDLRGLKCPLPVLRLRKYLEHAPDGAEIRVLATDPLAAIDIPHFCKENGYPLIASGKQRDCLQFKLRKPSER